jgi:NYN domain-containing protein
MITTSDASPRLAVLIDADNAQPGIADGLLVEVANYGTAHVKRAYGDWTGAGLRGWKEQLHSHSIQPMQQFSYTTGKNATDAGMIIDAMDLLYTGRFDGFCIVNPVTATSPASRRACASPGSPSTASANARHPSLSSPPATSSSTPKICAPRPPAQRRPETYRRRPAR